MRGVRQRVPCLRASDPLKHASPPARVSDRDGTTVRASIMEPARPAGSTATSEKSLLAEREKERESGAGG